jgi:hypothetical protein
VEPARPSDSEICHKAPAQCVEEEKGHLFPLPERQQRELTRRSYHCIVSRVKRKEKYRKLGMYDGWQGEGGYDRFVAHVGLRERRGLTLHRIDDKVGYFPGNVEWATKKKQAEERSTTRFLDVGGRRMTLSSFASILGQGRSEVSRRIDRLMSAGFTEQGAVERMISNTHMHSVQPTATHHQPKGLFA